MRILVCGGAGYIGSHMCKLIAAHGHPLAVIDNLSTGHRQALRYGEFFEGDIADDAFVEHAFKTFRPDSVIHFAARSLVAESVHNPALYYKANVVASLSLLEHVRRWNCPLVFSSTAAVYGTPRTDLINEAHPRHPLNSYGRTKATIEDALVDYWNAYALPSVTLRYFNAAGADPDGMLGEAHEPETHLIPRALEYALGRGTAVKVYGDDYDTPDGTCIRDYVYVGDLCAAHLLALRFLQKHRGAHQFNLGNGLGFSVKAILGAIADVIGRPLDCEVVDRRPGDPARLVADAAAARESLGWEPEMPAIEGIIDSAWRWHRGRLY